MYLHVLLLSLSLGTLVRGQDCNNKADLFFVIDGSESVKEVDFRASKQFVIDVIEPFDIGEDTVHIGANVFGTRVYDGMNLFGPSNENLLYARIKTLKRNKFGTTLTNLAIEDMRKQYQRRGRDDVVWVGVVITDGKSVDILATADQAQKARGEGINMIAVGVGESFREPAQAQVTMAELFNIAGDMRLVKETLNISSIVTEIQTLMKSIVCPQLIQTTAATAAPTTHDHGGTDTDGCTDCLIDKDHGYWKHPHTCMKYIHIYPGTDGSRMSVTQKCEPGLFWDQSLLTCTRPELVDCENDPCKNRAVASYDVDGICNAFINCLNGRSFRSCCPINHRYVAGSGCVEDPSCMDSCNGEDDNSLLGPDACPSVRHPTMKGYYIENVPGHGNITRLCPYRTVFDNALCVCNTDNSPWVDRLTDCNPEAEFPFTSNFSDSSKNRLYLGTELVSIQNGAAKFTGNGMVNIYRFSKDDFGQVLVIRLQFKSNADVGTTEALLTNCIYGSTEQASIAITVTRSNTDNYVEFRTDTDEDTEKFSVPFDPARTNDLIYIYDGNRLTGSVNGVTDYRQLSGNILRSTSGIIIGAGSQMFHFNGEVGQFELYKCFPAFAENMRS